MRGRGEGGSTVHRLALREEQGEAGGGKAEITVLENMTSPRVLPF